MIKKKTLAPLLNFLAENQPVKAHNIAIGLSQSRAVTHKYLNYCMERKIVKKSGVAPHVWYMLVDKEKENNPFTKDGVVLWFTEIQLLDLWFLVYDVNGKALLGYTGFVTWCKQRDLDIEKTFLKFKKKIDDVNDLRDSCGMIVKWFNKFKEQIKESYLDALYYCDVYQLAQFGKSRLWSLAFYAKQSQSLKLIDQVAELTRMQLACQ